jgi:hypothetical protein
MEWPPHYVNWESEKFVAVPTTYVYLNSIRGY